MSGGDPKQKRLMATPLSSVEQKSLVGHVKSNPKLLSPRQGTPFLVLNRRVGTVRAPGALQLVVFLLDTVERAVVVISNLIG